MTKNLEALPFVKRLDDGLLFWSVSPSGDYAKDCRTGRNYAVDALEHLVRDPDRCLLSDMALAMIRVGDAKSQQGLLIGFWEAIQHYARQAAKEYGTASYRARFEALEEEYDRRLAAELAEDEAKGHGGAP